MAVCWFNCDGTGFSLKMAKVTVPAPPPGGVYKGGGTGRGGGGVRTYLPLVVNVISVLFLHGV